jgi:hypothetical protein
MKTARILCLAALSLPALGLPVLAGGCSLMGLDKFQQARCTMDSECASLEAIRPTGDTCRTWQCNNAMGGQGVCEILVRDDDGDGSPPMMCAVGVAPDCDDTNPARSATALEACNLVDDDCDGVIDPSFTGTSSTVATLGASPGRVTFSRGLTGSEVSVVRVPPTGTADPLQLGTVTPGGSAMLVLTDAMTNDAERGVGAHATLGDAGRIVVYDPVASAPDCGGDATRPIQARWLRSNGSIAATACLEQTTLASAVLAPEPDGDVLLVWVDDAAPRECGSAATSAVRARVLRTIGGATPRIDASPALDLGTTGDALGPSVAFVPGQGWVVAHVTAGNDVEVHRVPVVTDLASASATSISTIDATMAAEASISVGAGTTIAVVYTDGGCMSPNRVVLRTADVSAGSVAFGPELPVTSDTSAGRRAPVAAYHAERAGEWAVFFRERDDEEAVRLDVGGRPIGMPIALGIGTVSGRPYVEALDPAAPATPSWGFLAVTTAGDVRSGTLACMEPM